MATTESITVTDELKNLQRAALEESDRFVNSVIQAHKSLPSDNRKNVLRGQSLFKFFSPIWRGLSVADRDVWRNAGINTGISGWQLFISDNAARLKVDLPLNVPPSELWQVRAGTLIIESPATEIVLQQAHPLTYFVSQKIVGASWKNQLVKLTEQFSLPLKIQIRYKSALTPVGGTQYARYFARIWTSYQGQDLFSDLVIDFSPNEDWTFSENEEVAIRGILISYTLYIEIVGYTGVLLFDNIRAVHGGTNWALDPRCDFINKTFSKGFATVPPFWVPVSLPLGSSFDSNYPLA